MPTKRKTRKMRGGVFERIFGKKQTKKNSTAHNNIWPPNSNTSRFTNHFEVGSIVKYNDKIGVITNIENSQFTIDNVKYSEDDLKLYTKDEVLRVANKIIDLALSNNQTYNTQINQLFDD